MTIDERIRNHVCCFCEGELEHAEGQNPDTWGNNPSNACTHEKARCCNHCNENIVIPVRVITAQIIDSALSDEAEEKSNAELSLHRMIEAAGNLASIFHPDDSVFDDDVKYIQQQVLKAFTKATAEMISTDNDISQEEAEISVLRMLIYDQAGID